jgi:vitamin B12 transporter
MTKQTTTAGTARAAIIFMLLISLQLQAEEALKLEDMLVTAGLYPVSTRDVASSITVITRAEIEQKQASYLSDLLRDVPGFAVSQAGGPGTQTQIRVRGAEANHLLVLIDGVRANDPALSDEFQYQFALTSNIERIEIIRGPQSATWGGDAVAGVINIIRSKDVESPYMRSHIEGGSFGTFNLAADGGYAGEVFHLTGGAAWLKTDGTNISRTGSEKDGSENATINIAVKSDPGDVISLRFSGQVVDSTNEFDDIDFFVTGLPTDADRETESRQSFLSAEASTDPNDSPWSGTFSLNWMDSENDNFGDGLWTSSTSAQTLEYRLRGGVNLGQGAISNHRISFALESEDVDFSQRGEASPFGDPNQDQSYDVAGYALEYVGRPITGFSWTLSGRLDDYSDFGDAHTWQVAASYQLTDGLRIRGSMGTGSKAPTFTERFGYFEDYFIGNPDLKPESSRSWEVGLDSTFDDGRYQFQLVWFDQDLRDEIDGFVFDLDTFLFTARNKTSDSQRKGLEAVFDAVVSEVFTLSASYTYTDATEEDAGGQSLREVRRPKHMATVAANYGFADNRGNLNLNLNYSGTQLDLFFSPVTFASERVEMGAYTLLDLATSWKLTKTMELTGRVSNLLDEDYEEILGFARPGRAVFAGLRGRF